MTCGQSNFSKARLMMGTTSRMIFLSCLMVWVFVTCNQNSHAIRSEHWRYIRYADGSAELYDHDHDPGERTNLANDPHYAEVIRDHARWLPTINAPPVPGSAARLLVKIDGTWYWEGKAIIASELED
jgi:choline-sulfatase